MKKTDGGGRLLVAQVAFDDDLPGGGQFYVWETGKHFVSLDAAQKHKKSRMFKRRLKELKEEQQKQAFTEEKAWNNVEEREKRVEGWREFGGGANKKARLQSFKRER